MQRTQRSNQQPWLKRMDEQLEKLNNHLQKRQQNLPRDKAERRKPRSRHSDITAPPAMRRAVSEHERKSIERKSSNEWNSKISREMEELDRQLAQRIAKDKCSPSKSTSSPAAARRRVSREKLERFRTHPFSPTTKTPNRRAPPGLTRRATPQTIHQVPHVSRSFASHMEQDHLTAEMALEEITPQKGEEDEMGTNWDVARVRRSRSDVSQARSETRASLLGIPREDSIIEEAQNFDTWFEEHRAELAKRRKRLEVLKQRAFSAREPDSEDEHLDENPLAPPPPPPTLPSPSPSLSNGLNIPAHALGGKGGKGGKAHFTTASAREHDEDSVDTRDLEDFHQQMEAMKARRASLGRLGSSGMDGVDPSSQSLARVLSNLAKAREEITGAVTSAFG